jgi:hypothetical protein
MPSKTFEVEVHGLDVLKRKLAGNLLSPVKDQMVKEAALAGRRVAAEKSKGRYGRKGLYGRLDIDFSNDGLVANVHPVRSIAGIAFTMEEGRRPGRRPPYTPIKRWLIDAGAISGQRGDSKVVRATREAIKAGGTRPIHFMQEAAEEAERTLKQRGPPTEREIERQWNA